MQGYAYNIIEYDFQAPQIMRHQCTNGLKGQQAHSPRQRLGYWQMPTFALKGQKLSQEATPQYNAFALSGRGHHDCSTQGVALGYELIAPMGCTQLKTS